jgi:hypothetical protein
VEEIDRGVWMLSGGPQDTEQNKMMEFRSITRKRDALRGKISRLKDEYDTS